MDSRIIIGIEAVGLFKKEKSGIDIYAMELIRCLQEIDHENEYVVFCKPGPLESSFQASPNFRTVVIDSYSNFTWEQFILPRAVRKNSCSFLHCTGNTIPIFCNTPTIVTIHSLSLVHKTKHWFREILKHPFSRNVYKYAVVRPAISKSKKIITVSKYAQKLIKESFGLPESKVVAIYNGISPNFTNENNGRKSNAFLTKHELPIEYILCIGSHLPEKNTTGTLAGYAHYHSISPSPLPLVITNYSEIQLRHSLSAINALKLRESIFLTPYISNRELPVLYASAKIFLYLSLYESFGMPLIEAMACGTATITSNTTALPEIAGNAALLVSPSNPKEIGEVLTQMIANRNMLKTFSENGKKQASLFSWKNTAIKMLATYMSQFN